MHKSVPTSFLPRRPELNLRAERTKPFVLNSTPIRLDLAPQGLGPFSAGTLSPRPKDETRNELTADCTKLNQDHSNYCQTVVSSSPIVGMGAHSVRCSDCRLDNLPDDGSHPTSDSGGCVASYLCRLCLPVGGDIGEKKGTWPYRLGNCRSDWALCRGLDTQVRHTANRFGRRVGSARSSGSDPGVSAVSLVKVILLLQIQDRDV
jgi:hypothetical protein